MKTTAFTQSHNLLLGRTARMIFFALLTGVAAWVRIPLPFTPVPVTLQTMVVLSCGVLLGRDGIYAMMFYLLLGGVGLPLFALPYVPALFGPSGGYLVGFVGAVWLIHVFVRPRWSELGYFRRALALYGVSLTILIPGALQLALWMNLSVAQAVALGIVPFLLGDLLKSFVVASFSSKG